MSITTVTVLVYFDGHLDLHRLFWALPIMYLDPLPVKGRAKPKLPHGPIGSIVAAQFGGYFRGLKKTVSQVAFENTISVDLSLDRKNICAKIYPNKIHLSGIYSDESIELACGQLLAYFKLLENDVKYLSTVDDEMKGKIMGWIEWLFKENRPSRIYENVHLPPEIPEELDQRTSEIMLRNYFDFPTFSDIYLSWIQTLISPDFSLGTRIPSVITSVDKLMSNFKLELGKPIFRAGLAKYLSGLIIPGISVRYDNTVNYAVKLLITDDSLFKSRCASYQTGPITLRKQIDGKPLHVFQIHASGKMMLSSRDDSTTDLAQQFVMDLLGN